MRRRLFKTDPFGDFEWGPAGSSMSLGFARRRCAVQGHFAPSESLRYFKSTYRRSMSPIADGLPLARARASSALNACHASQVGAARSGTPLDQRPAILARTISFAWSALTRCVAA